MVRQGKTAKFIQDIISFHRKNPHEPIYVSNELVKGILSEHIPESNIKVVDKPIKERS